MIPQFLLQSVNFLQLPGLQAATFALSYISSARSTVKGADYVHLKIGR
jgi:hypothetical protein